MFKLKVTSIEGNIAYTIVNPGTDFSTPGTMDLDKITKEGFSKEWLNKVVIWNGIEFCLVD